LLRLKRLYAIFAFIGLMLFVGY